jgi:hypothetical protein
MAWIVAVTGLENETPDMDSWWGRNKEAFKRYKMEFDDHACITTVKGKWTGRKYAFETEHQASKQRVLDLITKHCTLKALKVRTS